MKLMSITSGSKPSGHRDSMSARFLIMILFIFGSAIPTLGQGPIQNQTSSIMSLDTWDDLGGGVTGFDVVVKTIVEHGGYVYVGGVFDTAGDGVPARNIARFNLSTSEWEAIGTGTDAGMGSMVNEIVVHNGLIYVGGYFSQMNGLDIANLAVYDPSGSGNWSSIGALGHSSPEFTNVFALHVFGDDLYVGGEFQEVSQGGSTLAVQHLARYSITGESWHRVGEYTASDPFDIPFMDGMVMAIDGNDTDLVFGGMFTSAGGQTVNGVVLYKPGTDTWTALGQDDAIGMGDLFGFSGFLSDVVLGNGVVYVAGEFFHPESNEINRLGSYTIADGTWTSLGDEIDGPIIKLLAHVDDQLFVSGEFTEVDGSPSVGVAQYIDLGGIGFWFPLGSLTNEGGMPSVFALGIANGRLIAGGRIVDADGLSVNNIARWSADFGGGSGGDLPDIVLTGPGDGAEEVSIIDPVTFSWSAPSGVTVSYYILEIYTSDNPDFPFFSNSSFDPILGTSFDYEQDFFGNLPFSPTTDYTWQVKGYNSTDQLIAQTTTRFSFTTEGPEVEPELATPTLVAPIGGVTGVSLTPTFTWSKDALATGYVLEYSVGATLSETPSFAFLPIAQLTDADPNYSYTLPIGNALTSNTEYSWRVTVAGDDPLEPKTSLEATFTTEDLRPGALEHSFNETLFLNENIELFNIYWNLSSGADLYELTLKIGDQVFPYSDEPITTTETSFVVDNRKLVDGFTYTLLIKAINEYGETSAEPITLIYTPATPVAQSPKDEASVDAGTEFTWKSTENILTTPGSVLIQILYADDETADPTTEPTDGLQFEIPGTIESIETKTLTELFATQTDVDLDEFLLENKGNTLYWRVTNKSTRFDENDYNTQRDVKWSDIQSFKITALPQAFNLLTPGTNATNISSTPTFTWGQSENATSYVLEISTSSNFETPLFTSESIARGSEDVVSYILATEDRILFGASYFWRVTAINEVGESSSGPISFTTSDEGVVLLSPGVDVEFADLDELADQIFNWVYYTNETYRNSSLNIYDRQFNANENPPTSAIQVRGYSMGSYVNFKVDRRAFVHGHTYHWQVGVQVQDENNNSSVLKSELRSFSVAPEKPVLNGPDANTEISSSTLFRWTTEERFPIDYSTSVAYRPGKFIVQILFDESTDVENLTADQGFQFEVPGTDALQESFTLAQLFAGLPENDTRTVADLLSRGGETLHWRVKIKPTYDPIENWRTPSERNSVWSDLGEFEVAVRELNPFASGSGTEQDPFVIMTLDQLQAMKDYLSSHFVLGADIDASATKDWNDGAGFEPIGTSSNSFSGSLDGKEFKISNLTINRPETRFVGLVGFSNRAKLINIKLENVNIVGKNEVGALVGRNVGTISDSYSSGTVRASDGDVGGLAGRNDIVISYSHFSGTVRASDGDAGGLVGRNRRTISNSYSSGAVIASDGHVGGLVGYQSSGSISNSYSSGTVRTSNSGRAGGLVGILFSGSISNSYSRGRVSASGDNASGLVGRNYANSMSTNSYWDAQTSGQSTSFGGTGKITAEMKRQSTFAGWDFTSVWQIIEGQSYPYLRNPAQNPPPGLTLPEVPVLSDVVETDVFNFSWSGDETASYIFEIDDNKTDLESLSPNATRSDITFAGTASGNSLELASGRLAAGTTYFWRVSLQVGSGENIIFVSSTVGEYTPKATPGVITGTSPALNATNIPLSGVTYSWEPDANATKYQVLVYKSDDLNTPIIDEMVDAVSGGGIQSYLASDEQDLSYSTNYSWRVIGYNGTKRGELNDYAKFRTQSIIPGGGITARNIRLIDGYPTRATSGQVIDKPFMVAVVDANGLLVENSNIEIGIINSNISAGTRTVRAINGVATFSDLVFNLPERISALTTKLTFVAIGFTLINSDDITITAPGSDKLVMNEFTATVETGGTLKNQPIISLSDAAGNVLTDKTDEVTVSISSGATLLGTTTVRAVAGKAAFTNLGVQAPVGNYTMTFTAPGYPPISKSVSVTAAATVVVVKSTTTLTGSNSDDFNTEYKAAVAKAICEALRLNSADCQRITIATTTTTTKTIGITEYSEITNTTDGLIPIFWNAPQDPLFDSTPIVHYPIEFREKGTGSWNVVAREQSADTVAVLTGLKLDTTYEVRIAFSTENVTSDFSDPIEIETIDLQTILDFIEEVADEIIATSIEVEEIPTEFALFQNYPNPFNPTTTIRFALPEPVDVHLEVYTILGQRMAVLSTGLKPAGYHSLQLDASQWASGIYLYRLQAGDRVFTRKLMLMK